MIDNAKILIKDNDVSKFLLSNLDSLFDNHFTTVKTTADNKTTTTFCNYKGFKFKITETGVITINGSLHKAMNNGLHNYNDFNYTSILREVLNLCTRFNINPHAALIQNLEIGVNLVTKFNPTEFTDRCPFLFSNGGVIKPAPITNNSVGFDNGIRFEMAEYRLKMYNKSKQYNQVQNILRIEYGTIKTRPINSVDIKSLYDLCNLEKLKLLTANYLIPVFNAVLVDEKINHNELTKRENKHYNNRLDFGYWNEASRTQRRRNRGYLNVIYNNHSLTDIKSVVGAGLVFKSGAMLSDSKEAAILLHAIENLNCTHSHTIYKRWDRIQFAA